MFMDEETSGDLHNYNTKIYHNSRHGKLGLFFDG